MVRLLSTLVISAAISLSQVASAAAQVQGPTSAQSATPYQMSRMGGFGLSVRNLRGERVRIRLRGNGFTTREIALDHLHLKAAELAVERGYTFFQITEPEIEQEISINNNIRYCLPAPCTIRAGRLRITRSGEAVASFSNAAAEHNMCAIDVIDRLTGTYAPEASEE